jgi:hypothetical protein
VASRKKPLLRLPLDAEKSRAQLGTNTRLRLSAESSCDADLLSLVDEHLRSCWLSPARRGERGSRHLAGCDRPGPTLMVWKLPLLCQVSVAISGFQRVHGMTIGEAPTVALIGLLDGGRGGIAGSDGGGDAASWVLLSRRQMRGRGGV